MNKMNDISKNNLYGGADGAINGTVGAPTPGEKVIPLFNQPKNSPFVSNIQKEIHATSMIEKGNYPVQGTVHGTGTGTQEYGQNIRESRDADGAPKGMNPLVNLQVYQPKKPKQEQSGNKPTFFMQPVSGTPYYPPQYGYQLPPYLMQYPNQQMMPIINTYNISMDGVNADHGRLSLIYEDMMPNQYTKHMGTATSIAERTTAHSFIRAMMFSQGDAKNIGLDSGSDNSLLSRLKFMDLNPYNTYKLSPNPYKGLANNFLIYRSCYPIRHEPVGSTVVCAKNSVGMNIRIYKLTHAAYNINSQDDKTKVKDYDEWREVAYYEYIREKIIKPKQSPNFIIMHGYYIAEKCGIDFDKIMRIKGLDVKKEPKFTGVAKIVPLNPLSRNFPNMKVSLPIQNGGVPQEINVGAQTNYVEKQNTNPHTGDVNIVLNPNAYVGKALVVITESPTYNLYGWASKTYQIEGSKKRQINTGFHLNKVWTSVLFQLMVAMYIMQIHNIYIANFNIEDNVYVKDLYLGGPVTRYWKYIIDGLEYYVPNYGYVVMIDTNYKDTQKSSTSILDAINRDKNKTSNEHKIYAEIFGDVDSNAKYFDAFCRAIDPNIYGQEFIDYGGCNPPDDIKELMSKMSKKSTEDKTKDIGYYIHEYMRCYLNNRIGTYLKELEIPNIRKDENREFTKGTIVVYEDGNSSYKFVLFVEHIANSGITNSANILTKTNTTDSDMITVTVPLTSLFNYSKIESVLQTFKINDAILNEEELLETYNISKNSK